MSDETDTFFGDLPGDFVGRGGTLFKRAAWIWFLIAGLAALLAFTAAAVARQPGSDRLPILLGAFVLVIEPDGRLGAEFWAGLPMPENIWG